MKRIKISLIINLLIVILVVLSCILMFNSIRFMPDKTLLDASSTEMFKFYTVDSNILMAVIAFIFIIYEIKLLKNKANEIPQFMYILKFIATSGISLTFVITACFLAPQYGFYAMYNNANLFLHLIIPVLSIVTYIFFEKHHIYYKYAILGIIPMVLYSIYYTFMILTHLDGGGLTYKYDFYGFLNGSLNNIYKVVPLIYLFAFLISIILLLLNKKIMLKNNKSDIM